MQTYDGTLVRAWQPDELPKHCWSIVVPTTRFGLRAGHLNVWRDGPNAYSYRILAHIDDEYDLLVEFDKGLALDEIQRLYWYWRSTPLQSSAGLPRLEVGAAVEAIDDIPVVAHPLGLTGTENDVISTVPAGAPGVVVEVFDDDTLRVDFDGVVLRVLRWQIKK